MGKGCVQVLQVFEQFKSKLSFFPVVFCKQKQVPSPKATSRYIRYMLCLQMKGKHLGFSDPQFASFVNSRGGKVFSARKVQKMCYQWDATARNKSRS